MSKFFILNNKEIENAFMDVTRQYLVGDLKKPQRLENFKSKDIEIGISYYENNQSEMPHMHTNCIEYQYMLEGYTEYMDCDTKEVYRFKKGDFYIILTGTKYAQRVKAGAKILFIKTPSINDKQLIHCDSEINSFLEKHIKSIRKDYYHNNDAPKANSIRPASSVAIFKNGSVLMLKRTDNNKWTLPGGTLEFNETMKECALREFKEECNLDIKILDIIGLYDDPNIRIEYLDGEVRREFTMVYYGEYISGDVKLDNESLEYEWVDVERLLTLDITESQKKRIIDVINYYKNGAKVI